MTELSPTQVALRELTMLTRCYCEGQRDGVGHPHPQLGHNCSFRADVMTLVRNIGAVLAICQVDTVGDRAGHQVAYDVRRALLGLEHDPGPPWREDAPAAAHSAQIAERLQRAEAARRQEEGGTSVPG